MKHLKHSIAAVVSAVVVASMIASSAAAATLWERDGVRPGSTLEANLVQICKNEGGTLHRRYYTGVITLESMTCTR